MKKFTGIHKQFVVSTKQFGQLLSPLSLAVASSLGLIAFSAPDMAFAAPGQFAEGRILVKGASGINESLLTSILEAHGSKSVGKIQHIGVHLVNVPPQAEEKVALALSKNPNIEFAELDMLVPHEEFIPNDPSFSSQWHHTNIKSTTAWDAVAGSGIKVAILDTGVDASHVDLKANLLSGWNSVDQSTNSSDIQGHGTKVAGTVGAVANNNTGVAGVAWAVNLIPIRVTNDSTGYAYFSDIARGVTWAADNGARVANASYGVTNSSSVTTAAKYMKTKGGLLVVSAGNSGTDLGMSDNPNIISVSATASNDSITSWSSYGNFVDITAPGAGIWTTTKGGGYGAPSGTSFSSPVTAGVVALIMSANPLLTPNEVENILKTSAKDLGSAGWDNKYGYGRVDSAAAVQMAISMNPAPAPAPDPQPTDTSAPVVSMSLTNGATVSGMQNISVNASDDTGVSKVELFFNGTRLGTDTTAPYAFSWDTSANSNGSATIEARASDAAGNIGRVSVNVNIDNPVIQDTTAPVVSITSMNDGDTVSGTTKIILNASDNNGVKTLACYVDGGLIGMSSDVNTLTCTWNTRKESTGLHTIQAVATDAAANNGETTISVTVGNGSTGGKGNGKGQ